MDVDLIAPDVARHVTKHVEITVRGVHLDVHITVVDHAQGLLLNHMGANNIKYNRRYQVWLY